MIVDALLTGSRAIGDIHSDSHSNKDSIVYPFFMRIVCDIKVM